jgi:hypothetical protein
VYDATPLYGEKSKYLKQNYLRGNKLAVTFENYNESLLTMKRRDESYKKFNKGCSQQ